MNIENPASYAIVMTSTASDRMSADTFPDLEWQKYMTNNFGARWEKKP